MLTIVVHPGEVSDWSEVMLGYDDVHAVAYQVLDQVRADHAVAAGARSAMFSVVDCLKVSSAPMDEVRRAEQISIELHKLEWALQQGDQPGASGALDELKILAVNWLHSRIGN